MAHPAQPAICVHAAYLVSLLAKPTISLLVLVLKDFEGLFGPADSTLPLTLISVGRLLQVACQNSAAYAPFVAVYDFH